MTLQEEDARGIVDTEVSREQKSARNNGYLLTCGMGLVLLAAGAVVVYRFNLRATLKQQIICSAWVILATTSMILATSAISIDKTKHQGSLFKELVLQEPNPA